MRNVTAPPRARQNRIPLIAIAVLAIALIVRAFTGHGSALDAIVGRFNTAVQADDMASVQKLENAETAAETTRQRLGRASDVLAPLGKLRSVKEVKDAALQPRWHAFDVAFAHGSVHERFLFDPQNKIVHFTYDAPETAK